MLTSIQTARNPCDMYNKIAPKGGLIHTQEGNKQRQYKSNTSYVSLKVPQCTPIECRARNWLCIAKASSGLTCWFAIISLEKKIKRVREKYSWCELDT